jgi:MerR family transcriptional regulator, thiopeptide resistance regulator
MRTVSEVSELAGVTVRTLHHYDEIGLLRPSGRSDAGYRLYAHVDLERLQEILVWRQLGFSLQEIEELLDEPGHDRVAALRGQRALVERQLERLGATAVALDAALTAAELGIEQQETRMFKDFDPAQYEDEARERWGETAGRRPTARPNGPRSRPRPSGWWPTSRR